MRRFRLDETYEEFKTAVLTDRDLFAERTTFVDESDDSDALDCSCTD